jgi:NCAIR mutase (PurE)-related protein
MTEAEIKRILDGYKSGAVSADDALARLRTLPFEDLDFANVDHHRSLRQGYPEVVFGAGKTDEELSGIVAAMLKHEHNVLITRSRASSFEHVRELAPQARFHARSGAISIVKDAAIRGKGTVMVVSAGTSDIPVAEEAVVTLEVMGNRTDQLYDVGVAGLHRLLDRHQRLADAKVIIVVAGMEGALPSVVGGLVSVPVIAVPTSIGYGASFQGVAALLGMLNSCASNVSVVNIDNGYGAGVVASLINRQ